MYMLYVDKQSLVLWSLKVIMIWYDSSTACCIKFEGSKKLSVLFGLFFHEKFCPVELT